ncbi:hypothetical protein AAG570_003943 [Ranatra chinensis]|uniref:Lipase domain-containing protein n=1 Tax=Ranatra chinensis TaxID=642074 RepID=A0ABD0YGW3_9HEMI
MVDWTDVAGILIYPIALLGVPVPGGDVANLVDALVAANVTTKPKTHLIGFSMGAHVAGTAGSLLAPKVGRITGLDAGGPGYNPFDLDNWLDKSDAVFVDGIHTCGGYLGYAGRYAHVDFYPNKGEPIQPACAGKLTPVCSHLESFRMFARTITNPTRYPASNSTSWSSFVNGGCAINSAAYMGEGVSPST